MKITKHVPGFISERRGQNHANNAEFFNLAELKAVPFVVPWLSSAILRLSTADGLLMAYPVAENDLVWWEVGRISHATMAELADLGLPEAIYPEDPNDVTLPGKVKIFTREEIAAYSRSKGIAVKKRP